MLGRDTNCASYRDGTQARNLSTQEDEAGQSLTLRPLVLQVQGQARLQNLGSGELLLLFGWLGLVLFCFLSGSRKGRRGKRNGKKGSFFLTVGHSGNVGKALPVLGKGRGSSSSNLPCPELLLGSGMTGPRETRVPSDSDVVFTPLSCADGSP